ncbi:hypothetical protein FACS189421_03130 [Bacteroidia bacterium]|nr:hypothetical protein FACS189421_03130 [Bacteroidia bacterium]
MAKNILNKFKAKTTGISRKAAKLAGNAHNRMTDLLAGMIKPIAVSRAGKYVVSSALMLLILASCAQDDFIDQIPENNNPCVPDTTDNRRTRFTQQDTIIYLPITIAKPYHMDSAIVSRGYQYRLLTALDVNKANREIIEVYYVYDIDNSGCKGILVSKDLEGLREMHAIFKSAAITGATGGGTFAGLGGINKVSVYGAARFAEGITQLNVYEHNIMESQTPLQAPYNQKNDALALLTFYDVPVALFTRFYQKNYE